jgi:hypothetical protein
MQHLKCNKHIALSSLQNKDSVSLMKERVVDSIVFYLVLAGLILIPIFNHGCHSSPHTDDELCLDAFEVKYNVGLNKKARPYKSGLEFLK